jgi:hypothetical protein
MDAEKHPANKRDKRNKVVCIFILLGIDFYGKSQRIEL